MQTATHDHGLTKSEIKKLRQVGEDMRAKDPDCRVADYDFWVYLLIVVVAALFIRAFIGEPVYVDGASMVPTLHDGERLIVEKVSYTVHRPERGDIVVCFYPGYRERRVKRVIGLPGETVEITNGIIYIDGNPLDEAGYWNDIIYDALSPHVVEEGCVFVVGDNRNNSADSRLPHIGDIPYEKIEGRAVCVIWPFSEIRSVS